MCINLTFEIEICECLQNRPGCICLLRRNKQIFLFSFVCKRKQTKSSMSPMGLSRFWFSLRFFIFIFLLFVGCGFCPPLSHAFSGEGIAESVWKKHCSCLSFLRYHVFSISFIWLFCIITGFESPCMMELHWFELIRCFSIYFGFWCSY